MHRSLRSAVKAAAAAAIVLPALLLPAQRGFAAPAAGTDTVRNLYAALLDTMKAGPRLGQSGRYARLEPVIRDTFDIAWMARLTVGAAWSALSDAQQRRMTEAFGRYIATVYADRFASFSGEQLVVEGEQTTGAGLMVRSRIVKSDGEPVSIDYLMRQGAGGAWQVADVYLDGTISELATHRSEFAAILREGGIDGLIGALDRKAALLNANAASAPQSGLTATRGKAT